MTGKRAKTLGEEIIEGLEEAVAFERGELPDVQVRRVALTARHAEVAPAPRYDRERIIEIRSRLALSQPVFAQMLNVSPNTVRAWEQGKPVPEGPSLRLIEIADRHPEALVDRVV